MGAEPEITENHNIPRATKMNVKKVTNIQKVTVTLTLTIQDQTRSVRTMLLTILDTPMLLLPAFPILIDAHA